LTESPVTGIHLRPFGSREITAHTEPHRVRLIDDRERARRHRIGASAKMRIGPSRP
jgi:hypothetical protein